MDVTQEAVSRLFAQGIGIKETASRAGCSEAKARKILITLGQYRTPLIDAVNRLHADGMSDEEIANKYGISAKAVSGMLPYSKGMYNAEYPTRNAIKIRAARAKKSCDNEHD